jgi:hypothetical protein
MRAEKGAIKFPESFQSYSLRENAEEEDYDWEPDWMGGTFFGTLACDNKSCNEVVVIAGDWKVQERLGPRGRWHGEYETRAFLRFATPPFLLIDSLPVKTPKVVGERIKEASAVLWVDPNAAGNRLRLAVEDLLTARGVTRFKFVRDKKTKKRTRQRMSTHERLIIFKDKWPDVAKVFMAVKWVGNQATHEASLTVEQAIRQAEFLERGLNLLYGTKDHDLDREVRAINKAKRIPATRQRKANLGKTRHR